MKTDFEGHFDGIEKNIAHLQISVDNLAKLVKDFRDEYIIMHIA